jgi:hypothetical protein
MKTNYFLLHFEVATTHTPSMYRSGGSTASPIRTRTNMSLMCAFVVFLFLLLGYGSLNAQVASYGFASTSGTYTAITGGTVLGAADQDDDSFDGIALPFTLNYGGQAMTYIGINSNGYVRLATSATGATTANFYNRRLSN